jgi:hypothetical protein
MRILVLAPQPFYSERGTPIAVRLVIESLLKRGHQVDVLTYAEGKDIRIKGLTIHRIYQPKFAHGVGLGFSWKKVLCDIFMAVSALNMTFSRKYDYIHAVEESVFIALLLKLILRISYVYDMDSSIPQQLYEKYPWFQPCLPVACFFEKIAVRNSIMTLPVCESLASSIRKYQPRKVFVLTDIALN